MPKIISLIESTSRTGKPYLFSHLVLDTDALGLEEVLQGLLLLTALVRM